MNVREAFHEILGTHGITTVFGNPGSNELLLLRDFPDDFRHMGNAMGNVTNAQAGHAPVIVISGQQDRKYTELTADLTDVDAPKLAEPLVKWSHEPARPQEVPQSLSTAQ